MNILIDGYGSIGKRHARNVQQSGHDVILLRHAKGEKNKEGFREYYSFADLFRSGEKIDGAIVCSPTVKHAPDVRQLLEKRIPFLLEKPPAVDLRSSVVMRRAIKQEKFKAYDIAFNLRRYPVLRFIKTFLPKLGRIYSARVYCGYHLANWRKGVDYRRTTSAKKELGGGVHIELVHEIDYILWFFGCPEKVIGYVNKISDLEISTEDICSAILQYKNGSIVELHLDYLSHKRLRGCEIIAQNGTLQWDINDGKVKYCAKNGMVSKDIFSLTKNYDFNETYAQELKHFLRIIKNKAKPAVDMDAAIDVMRVLEAIKISSKKEKTVYLKNI